MVSPAGRGPGTPARVSPWREVTRLYPPGNVAGRYVRVVECRARAADLVVLAATAREDLTRLATALGGVLALHRPDGRGRCVECSHGPWLVDWPCRTHQAVSGGLRDGWPGVTR